MHDETPLKRGTRILEELKAKYPHSKSYDLDGRSLHFVCEVEPVDEHPQYDRAVKAIISSIPHKHLKMKQWYTIISGSLELTVGDKTITLSTGDKYTVEPRLVHSAKSVGDKECWVEIYSEPGWTKEDHIRV